MAISKRRIQAEFLTASYSIKGEVHVGSAGLGGYLNDSSDALVEVYEAGMARNLTPSKMMAIYDLAELNRKEIIAVCLKRREDVGPRLGLRVGYEPVEYPVWLTTAEYEIEGTIEWSGHFEFSTLMAEGRRNFIPLYQANIQVIMVPKSKIECDALFVNRNLSAPLR